MGSTAYGLWLYGSHTATPGARAVSTPLEVCLHEAINLLYTVLIK